MAWIINYAIIKYFLGEGGGNRSEMQIYRHFSLLKYHNEEISGFQKASLKRFQFFEIDFLGYFGKLVNYDLEILYFDKYVNYLEWL